MTAELRAQALRLLARRDHTRKELQRKLTAAGDTDDGGNVTTLLDELEASGLLSDARFAESYLASRGRRFGATRLRHDLRLRGVAEPLIDAALAGAAVSDVQHARDIWRRKFGTAPANARELGRQMRFLQSRGFAADTLKVILKDEDQP